MHVPPSRSLAPQRPGNRASFRSSVPGSAGPRTTTSGISPARAALAIGRWGAASLGSGWGSSAMEHLPARGSGARRRSADVSPYKDTGQRPPAKRSSGAGPPCAGGARPISSREMRWGCGCRERGRSGQSLGLPSAPATTGTGWEGFSGGLARVSAAFSETFVGLLRIPGESDRFNLALLAPNESTHRDPFMPAFWRRVSSPFCSAGSGRLTASLQVVLRYREGKPFPSGFPISQWCPEGSAMRPCRIP